MKFDGEYVRLCKLFSTTPVELFVAIVVSLRLRTVASARTSSKRRSDCFELSQKSFALASAALICALCAADCASISARRESFCDLKKEKQN